MKKAKKVLITGCAGFIMSRLALHWNKKHPKDKLYGVDNLSYGSDLNNLTGADIKLSILDIATEGFLKYVARHKFDLIIHGAATSSVDIGNQEVSRTFVNNAIGTFLLLEAVRIHSPSTRVVYVSTDEVRGQLGPSDPAFTSKSQYNPTSIYSSSKACGDMLAKAYAHTFDVDVVVTNCSNNFGPHQSSGKLVPNIIQAILDNRVMEVYGSGNQVRDWIHVDDHCEGIRLAALKGKKGTTYLFGGGQELTNLEMIALISKITGKRVMFHKNASGRPKDDQRYAINNEESFKQLGFVPKKTNTKKAFSWALAETIDWYRKHRR